MAIVTSRWRDAASQWRRPALSVRVRVRRSLRLFFGHYRFSSITGRIIVLNLFGVAILVSGIFYLDQGRVRFTQTRVESISAQAAIIASAIGQIAATQSDITKYANPQSDSEVASPLLNPDLSSLSFQINPADVVPILNDLVAPTKTR